MERCRACNNEGNNYNDLFKVGIILDEMKTLGELLNFCTNIEVLPDEDYLPQHICDHCAQVLAQSYQFKKSVIETDKLLRNENVLFVMPEIYDEEIVDECENKSIVHYSYAEDIDVLEEVVTGGEEIHVEEQKEEKEYSVKNELYDVDDDDDDDDDDGSNEYKNLSENNKIDDIEEIPFDNFDCINDIEIVSTPHVAVAEEEVVAVKEENDNHHLIVSVLTGDMCDPSACYELIEEVEVCNVENNSDDHSLMYETNQLNDVIEEELCQFDDNNKNDDDNISLLTKMRPQKRPFKPRNMQTKDEKINNPDYKCTICEKQLRHYNSFKYHMQLHSEEPAFVCKICDLGFKTRNAFDGHISTHNPNNPNKCKICGKCYRQSSSLRSHMLKHTGEKPFTCPVCGKGMTQKSGFKKHMLIHTGEKPHICDLCNRRFRYSSNLLTHRRRHMTDKAFRCLECGNNFSASHELNRHMAVHNIVKTFPCDLCDEIFKRRVLLNTHWQTHCAIQKDRDDHDDDGDGNHINIDGLNK